MKKTILIILFVIVNSVYANSFSKLKNDVENFNKQTPLKLDPATTLQKVKIIGKRLGYFYTIDIVNVGITGSKKVPFSYKTLRKQTVSNTCNNIELKEWLKDNRIIRHVYHSADQVLLHVMDIEKQDCVTHSYM
jgi:endogenous inhibitor of DNA gyrase (YacG/DUF329 family)